MKVEVRVVRVLYVLIAREAVFYDVIDGRVVFGDEVVDSHRWAEPVKPGEFTGVEAGAVDPVTAAGVR